MKLTSALVNLTLNQFEAEAIPENHPALPKLNSQFGDHTFFLSANGLSIVEPAGKTDSGSQTAQVVKIADWKDTDRTSLVPRKPEPTGLVVVLEASSDDAA